MKLLSLETFVVMLMTELYRSQSGVIIRCQFPNFNDNRINFRNLVENELEAEIGLYSNGFVDQRVKCRNSDEW